VKIAFVGKGGSGKTTLTALLARHLVARGWPVLAIDADINQHLAETLGLDERQAASLPAMGAHLHDIKAYLRGTNPRIRSVASMVKTTPPGRGSRLLRLAEPNPLSDLLERRVGGVRLLVTGPFDEADLGVACYHAKVGAVELWLNHLIDAPGEYILVDMTAGADAFASGLFTRFDHTFLVAEPTRKAVGVYRQYQAHAKPFGVPVSVVGNKVHTDDDVAFLHQHVGDDLLVCLGQSAVVRAMEQGRSLSPEALEAANRTALERIQQTIDASGKDWARFQRQAVEFHLRNARAWANARTGEDLSGQIDPDFRLEQMARGGSVAASA
jgi:CO dehydrogenase maturation factor